MDACPNILKTQDETLLFSVDYPASVAVSSPLSKAVNKAKRLDLTKLGPDRTLHSSIYSALETKISIKPLAGSLMQKEAIEQLLRLFGERYSTSLRIDLSSRKSEEVFRWFLASILFGAPMPESICIRTHKEFEKEGLTTAESIVKAGWDKLVEVLDRGHYTRLDFKTADKLLEVMGRLEEDYDGDLNSIHEQAKDPRDLEMKIKRLGKGIGDITVNIFLRELRGIWEKADPLPQQLVILAAGNLGFADVAKDREQILHDLKEVWEENKVPGKDFTDFEAALLKLGKDFCKKRKCVKCPLADYCTKS